MKGFGRLVAFVRPELDQGPILYADADFHDAVADSGWDISDHDCDAPQRGGLMVFEGYLEIGPEPDPDVSLVGTWRELTHWEMCRVRAGFSPFGESP